MLNLTRRNLALAAGMAAAVALSAAALIAFSAEAGPREEPGTETPGSLGMARGGEGMSLAQLGSPDPAAGRPGAAYSIRFTLKKMPSSNCIL